MKYKILDTNIILSGADNILTLGSDGSIIVIPETTIDELDSKKSVVGEIGYQAREFGRLLSRADKVQNSATEDLTITRLSLDGVLIEIAASSTYPDFKDTSPSIINDRKIIEIAVQYHNIFVSCDILFMSNDVMCRIRAESLGLATSDMKSVDKTSFEFTKIFDVSAEEFGSLHNKPILSIDPDYIPENYNYKFNCPTLGHMKLGTISNGIISIIGKDTERELRAQDAAPINAEQLFLSKAIQDPLVDLIVCEAKAGSGKTVTAISNAMKLVKTNTPYTSITYIRASIDDVDDIEAVGFLPGLDEKFAVYLHPLKDSLDFIARSRYKNSKLKGAEYEEFIEEKVEKMYEDYNIRAITGLGMRGRTFTDTVVIIDEVQGQTKSSLQKMLTRFGKNCKVIIIGSQNQIDNKYVTKYNNGLSVLLDACTKPSDLINMHAVTLHKVARSAFAEWSENLFSEGTNNGV